MLSLPNMVCMFPWWSRAGSSRREFSSEACGAGSDWIIYRPSATRCLELLVICISGHFLYHPSLIIISPFSRGPFLSPCRRSKNRVGCHRRVMQTWLLDGHRCLFCSADDIMAHVGLSLPFPIGLIMGCVCMFLQIIHCHTPSVISTNGEAASSGTFGSPCPCCSGQAGRFRLESFGPCCSHVIQLFD